MPLILNNGILRGSARFKYIPESLNCVGVREARGTGKYMHAYRYHRYCGTNEAKIPRRGAPRVARVQKIGKFNLGTRRIRSPPSVQIFDATCPRINRSLSTHAITEGDEGDQADTTRFVLGPLASALRPVVLEDSTPRAVIRDVVQREGVHNGWRLE